MNDPGPYRIILSDRATANLKSIFQYIAEDSPQNASSMVDRILGAMENLKLFPHRTVVESRNAGLKHPVRSLPVQSYVIFFRVLEKQQIVRILQVRHGAQRRPKRFGH